MSPEKSKRDRPMKRFSKERLASVLDDEALVKRLEGIELKKHSLQEEFSLDELKRVLPTVTLDNLHETWGQVKEKLDDTGHRVESILSKIDDPIAIFGSFALYQRDPKSTVIPDDIDIATTPTGLHALHEELANNDQVVITDEMELVHPDTELASLRFAGYFLSDGYVHPFEAFGEGGEYNGEKLGGVFKLADLPPSQQEIMIEGHLFTNRALKSAYQVLQEQEKVLGAAAKRRTGKIFSLKREIQSTRDNLRLSEVRKRLRA